MDFDGRPHKKWTFQPHTSLEQSTFEKHKWMVRRPAREGKKFNFNGGDINGDNWYKFRPGDDGKNIFIYDTPPQPIEDAEPLLDPTISRSTGYMERMMYTEDRPSILEKVVFHPCTKKSNVAFREEYCQ